MAPTILHVSITFGAQTFTDDYVVCRTRAPRAYDYGQTIRVEGERGEDRIVAIPVHDVVVQTGRYASGMYFAAPLDEYVDEAAILDAVANKLFRD
jgi:hypothetical protein